MKETELRTFSNVYNASTKAKQLIHEQYNAVHNVHTIMKAYKEGRAKDFSEEPKQQGRQCIVTGSGPSLDEAIPYLKDWKGDIIVTTSHASTLIYHGIEPTYIYALDPFSMKKEISGIDWTKYKTKLITTPTVWTDLIEFWPNEILLYRQNLPMSTPWYTKDLSIMYSIRSNIEGGAERDYKFDPIIKTQMVLFSCSPPGQLFCSDLLKYDRIFLIGCDFAYNDEKERFTEYFKNTGEWREVAHPYVPPTIEKNDTSEDITSNSPTREITTSNGLLSNAHHLYYKKNMLSAIRLSMQDVWVCGKGAITELPQITPEKLIKQQQWKKKPRGMKKSLMKKVLEKYLAHVGAFVIVCQKDGKEAYTFIESECPEVEIVCYMAQMKVIYTCDKCGAELKDNDFNVPQDLYVAGKKGDLQAQAEIWKRATAISDKTGDTCINCKEGKLVHKFDLDIKSNMKRFRRMLK